MAWNSERGPRIAVLGAGAQGGSIGADLAIAGLDVTLVEQWPSHVEAIREHGITVNLPTRTFNAKVPALHLCQVAEIRDPFDVVFLVVKAYDSAWSCHLIEPCLAPDGVVVGIQNGMTIDAVAAAVGAERTIGVVFDMASNMFTPGITTRQNDRDTSWFGVGALEPSTLPKVERVAELLQWSGTVEVMDDIRSAKWMKLVVNTAQLVPSAILDLPFAEAVRLPGMADVMRAAGYEAMEAAIACGAKLVPILGMKPDRANDPERFADRIFDRVLETFMMSDTLTTVLQDWHKGRRAEVRDINGLVVDSLRQRGRASPVNERIVDLALRIERNELRAGPSNLDLLLGHANP